MFAEILKVLCEGGWMTESLLLVAALEATPLFNWSHVSRSTLSALCVAARRSSTTNDQLRHTLMDKYRSLNLVAEEELMYAPVVAAKVQARATRNRRASVGKAPPSLTTAHPLLSTFYQSSLVQGGTGSVAVGKPFVVKWRELSKVSV